MAEDKNKEGEEDETAAPAAEAKAGGSKLLLIVGAVVALLIAAGVPTAYFLLKAPAKQGTEELGADAAHGEEGALQPEGADDEDEADEGEEPLGAIFPLDSLTVNLSGGRFVRCQIQFEFAERDVPKRFYTRLVPLRDALITLLTKRTADDLLSEKGKDTLRSDIKDIANELLRKEDVRKVYLTQFVVQ